MNWYSWDDDIRFDVPRTDHVWKGRLKHETSSSFYLGKDSRLQLRAPIWWGGLGVAISSFYVPVQNFGSGRSHHR